MQQLSNDELIDLEETIIDKLDEIIYHKNRDGSLEHLLREMGLDDVVAELEGVKEPLSTWPDGKILLVGALPRMADDLRGVLKSLGIKKDRLELLEYEEVTNFDVRKLSYTSRYCAVLFGATPHKGKGIEGDSSVIVHMEKHRDEFPETIRLSTSKGLTVTKTNFREAIEDLIRRGLIMPDAA